MLVKGLPREALVRTPTEERGREPWTAYHELLAQLVEVTSVAAAEHRLKKPLKVPRPQHVTARRADRKAATQDNPYRAAIAQLGGSQPSRKREQLAAGGADGGAMTPPPPRGSYRGAMALLASAQPRSRRGNTA